MAKGVKGFVCENDWVLMEPEEVRETEGGILIPETSEPDYSSRTGLCVGKGTGVLVENGERAPMRAVEGRRYEYLTYANKRVKIGGKEYDVVQDRHLVGFYEE